MLTNNEIEVLKHIDRRGYIPSTELKKIFNIELGRGKVVLTKKNFPNIRHKLRSFMTAESNGMCRGGYLWFSAVEWKDGHLDLREFIKRELSILTPPQPLLTVEGGEKRILEKRSRHI